MQRYVDKAEGNEINSSRRTENVRDVVMANLLPLFKTERSGSSALGLVVLMIVKL